MTKLEQLLEQSKKIRDAATPGKWRVQSRTLSNVGPIFIWTELGWLDQLSTKYNHPSVDFIAYARNTHEIKDQMIAVMFEALNRIDIDDVDSNDYIQQTISVALTKIEQLATQALGEVKNG
jgi:hypothetical protein